MRWKIHWMLLRAGKTRQREDCKLEGREIENTQNEAQRDRKD